VSLPNLDRLAQSNPDTLTARQLQVLLIRREAENTTGSATAQAMRTTRLGAEVPALLAHIDELYGEIATLHGALTQVWALVEEPARKDYPMSSEDADTAVTIIDAALEPGR
jgi:hypothetical protein